MISNLHEALKAALEIDGALGVALGDWNTGSSLGQISVSNRFPENKLEAAIAHNSNVIKAKYDTRKALGLSAKIEDILIKLNDQYHLICICEAAPSTFFYLAMDRNEANLDMADITLRIIEQSLEL